MFDRSHVLPRTIWATVWLTVLRGLQLALSITIISLLATESLYITDDSSRDTEFYGVDPSFYVYIFTAIATLITVVYILVATFALPFAYNYWAILGFDMLAAVFWLVSFALLSPKTASLYKVTLDLPLYHCDPGFISCEDKQRLYDECDWLIAITVIGALEFGLFIITLCFTSFWLHRHRREGGRCLPVDHMYNHSSFFQPKPVASHNEMANV